eukprot:978928-Prymnesium_polylepis.2
MHVFELSLRRGVGKAVTRTLARGEQHAWPEPRASTADGPGSLFARTPLAQLTQPICAVLRRLI